MELIKDILQITLYLVFILLSIFLWWQSKIVTKDNLKLNDEIRKTIKPEEK